MKVEKTRVIFRKWSNGNVVALFPREIAAMRVTYCMSYMHIGQHSAADISIIDDTKPATPEEYADLKAELERIGYDLEVFQRTSHKDLEARYAKLKQLEEAN
jgi:hypothetical protein